MARVDFSAEEWSLIRHSFRAFLASRPAPGLREFLALRVAAADPALAGKVRRLDDEGLAELHTRLVEAELLRRSEAAPPVLVVDDNEHAAEALALYLRLEGFAAVTASNGEEALEYLRGNPPPCLIVLDLTMPVMDGWQFRREQLRDPQLARVPVVLCTAVPPLDSDPVLDGVLDTFVKPVDPSRLAEQARLCCRPSTA
jgi:CheY-like chemotaxis protein